MTVAPTGLGSVPRRLHPLSPIAHAARFGPGLLVAVLVTANGLPGGILARLALTVVLVLVGASFAWVGWRYTRWWFGPEGDLHLLSGVISRHERRAQLSRLQAVDVVRPFGARLVGLAEVRLEMAGGDGGQVSLSFLADAEADELRHELLARAAGVRGTEEHAPVAPERVMVQVPARDLALSILLDLSLILGSVIALVTVLATVLTGHAGLLVGLLLAGGVPGVGAVQGFLRYYDFTLAESPDGLRMRNGLLSTRAQTVPPGRVQAVQVSQPLLWRGHDWYRLQVNIAGAAGGDEEERGAVLLPVAPRAVVREVLARILPGVDIEAVPLASAPPAARRRAWFQFPRLATGADDNVFVARGGWLVRRVDVVPHARTQSVRVTQGPWERALGLASVHVDSTPGPVHPVAAHRGLADAYAIAEAQAVRARAARQAFRPERWMRPTDPVLEPEAP